MYVWIDGWLIGWLDERKDRRMVAYMDECVLGRMDVGWVDELLGGWMVILMVGWTDR
jgi:hypothetical protein